MADVCKEYGAGLYLLAEEARLEKEFYEQLVQIKTILEENPSYSKLLSSPSLAFAEKKILMDKEKARTNQEAVELYGVIFRFYKLSSLQNL